MNMTTRLATRLALCGVFILASTQAFSSDEKPLATRRQHGLSIAFTTPGGELIAGTNHFCVLIGEDAARPVSVGRLSVEFAQQVGKIRQAPIRGTMNEQTEGRYCGKINLGRQYYRPAFYHVTVEYADSSGKIRKWRFMLTME
jgi:hypothetical protein